MTEDNVVEVDSIDREILELLNLNGSLRPQEVADQLAISHEEAGQRVGRLEENGAITNRFAVLDPRKVGYTVPGYAFAQCEETYDEALKQSLEYVDSHGGVQSIGTVYGEYDIIIRKLSDDVHKLNNFATNAINYSTAQKTCPTTELVRFHGLDVPSDEWAADSDIVESIDDIERSVMRALQADPTLVKDRSALAQEVDEEFDKVNQAVTSLEKRNVILGYSINLGLDALDWGRAYVGISSLSDLPPTNDNERENYAYVREELTRKVAESPIRKDNLHVPIIGSGLGISWADIFIELHFESASHLDRLTDEIRKIDGVRTTRTYIEANAYHTDTTVPLSS